MSIVEKIKTWWYRGDTDIYDPNDFDELWEMEEPGSSPSSPFLNHTIKKDKGIGYQFKYSNRENTKVLEHPTLTAQSEVLVVEPRSFEDALDIVEQLRCRKSVVLNLQYLDAEQSQRVVDFLSGATHALDGHQQRVGQGVFIFAPSNFVLNTESQESRALKDAFWNRREREQESQHQYTESTMKQNSIF